MARAYGAWYRSGPNNRMRVSVYVVDPSVITLLRGGYLDLAEHLDDTLLRVGVTVISPQGFVERYLEIVPPTCTVGTITRSLPTKDTSSPGHQWPRLDVYPPVYAPRQRAEPDRNCQWSPSTSIEDLDWCLEARSSSTTDPSDDRLVAIREI